MSTPRVHTPSTYRILDTDTVPAFIGSVPEIRALLGGQPESWLVRAPSVQAMPVSTSGKYAFSTAAFYSYAYPEPKSFRDRAVTPGPYYEAKLGEFILPYDTVRRAADPEELVLDFLSRTYEAAADAGGWDRARLECSPGLAGRVRPLRNEGDVTD